MRWDGGFPAVLEAWHELANAALGGGWTNFGAPWSTAAYAKDSAGFVHLKGTLTAGTFGAVIFTLPVGYRPAQNLFEPSAAQRNAYIYNDGSVEIATDGSDTTAGLDGIVFKAGA